MKKLGLVVMVVVLAATVSMAQNRGGNDVNPKERAEREVQTLTEKLDLSKDQQAKVYDVVLKGNNDLVKMRKQRSAGGGDRDAMREKMKSVRTDQNKEMKKILSDSQWEAYEKYQEERRSKRGTRGGGGQR